MSEDCPGEGGLGLPAWSPHLEGVVCLPSSGPGRGVSLGGRGVRRRVFRQGRSGVQLRLSRIQEFSEGPLPSWVFEERADCTGNARRKGGCRGRTRGRGTSGLRFFTGKTVTGEGTLPRRARPLETTLGSRRSSGQGLSRDVPFPSPWGPIPTSRRLPCLCLFWSVPVSDDYPLR